MKKVWPDEVKALFALALVETCFRNTILEDFHAGKGPVSATGDFSDVSVHDAEGVIAWNDLSRISDEEMKALMIQAVDRVFTFVEDPIELLTLGGARSWETPKIDEGLRRTAQRRAAVRAGLSQEEAWKAFPIWPSEDEGGAPLSSGASPNAPTPHDLRALSLAASLDGAWVRQAREALAAAADLLEDAEQELRELEIDAGRI